MRPPPLPVLPVLPVRELKCVLHAAGPHQHSWDCLHDHHDYTISNISRETPSVTVDNFRNGVEQFQGHLQLAFGSTRTTEMLSRRRVHFLLQLCCWSLFTLLVPYSITSRRAILFRAIKVWHLKHLNSIIY